MQLRKIDRVRKRDGRIVPYEETKIADAIYHSACSVGIDNKFLAQDLAGVVTMYLERYYTKDVPESREIREMVEKIIMDTGNAKIARAFILHGDNKWKDKPSAAPDAQSATSSILFPEGSLLVSSMTRDEVTAWGREKIAAALVKEAGIPAPAADEIAAAVEEKILRSGMNRISTAIIRELADNELFQRGYGSKLRKQLVVGLPKYDLRRLIGEEEEPILDPEQLCLTIGESALRQYALQEIFAKEVADAHLEGRIHIHNLEYPLKMYWLAPSIVRAAAHADGGAPALSPRSPRQLTSGIDLILRQARKYFTETVEFNHVNAAYAPMIASSTAADAIAEARHLAATLAQFGEYAAKGKPNALCGIDVDADAGRADDDRSPGSIFVRELLQGLRSRDGARSGGIPVTVAFHLNASPSRGGRSDALLRVACRYAAEVGDALFVFHRGEHATPKISRFSPAVTSRNGDRWFAAAQTISINLPQAVYRAEIDGRDFYAELDDAIALAVDAHRRKSQVLRRLMHKDDGDFGRHLGWTTEGRGTIDSTDLLYVVGISGLHEAVSLLAGQSMAKEESAVKLALRIVSYLYFRIREESRKHRIRLTVEDVPQDDAIERFSRIDNQMYPRARGILQEEKRLLGYSPGFHLRAGSVADLRRAMALEGRFHTLIESGTVRIPRSGVAALSEDELRDLVLEARDLGVVSQLHILSIA